MFGPFTGNIAAAAWAPRDVRVVEVSWSRPRVPYLSPAIVMATKTVATPLTGFAFSVFMVPPTAKIVAFAIAICALSFARKFAPPALRSSGAAIYGGGVRRAGLKIGPAARARHAIVSTAVTNRLLSNVVALAIAIRAGVQIISAR